MKVPLVSNLFASLTARPEHEVFERIVDRDAVVLERIVSFGHVTEPGNWYDQDRDEWVLLLSGGARLRFEDGGVGIDLVPGDCLLIPAHCRHRVDWTDPGCQTVWLALHLRASEDAGECTSPRPAGSS